MALELTPASKSLLGSDIPQGNTGLPRTWVPLSKRTPDQVKARRQRFAFGMFDIGWTHHGFWAQIGPWGASGS